MYVYVHIYIYILFENKDCCLTCFVCGLKLLGNVWWYNAAVLAAEGSHRFKCMKKSARGVVSPFAWTQQKPLSYADRVPSGLNEGLKNRCFCVPNYVQRTESTRGMWNRHKLTTNPSMQCKCKYDHAGTLEANKKENMQGRRGEPLYSIRCTASDEKRTLLRNASGRDFQRGWEAPFLWYSGEGAASGELYAYIYSFNKTSPIACFMILHRNLLKVKEF